ncbi:hypothetical protein ACGFNU_09390 [Spirillospora sp. NPDC048911]|uniref:hypothetical protein n=1 Tax=Spirillospora sp. NPDC048911 TaxID=3364527 RepID=UPI003718E100
MPGKRRAHPRPGKERGRRSLSLLVAAPALFTIVVITVSLVAAANRGPGHRTPAAPASPSPTATPPPDGWYTLAPVTGTPNKDCVAVLQDNQGDPTLSRHPCDAEDRLQRIWLQSVAVRTYLLKVQTSPTAFWCTTLDSPEDGARLHVKPCDKNQARQRFYLEQVPGERTASSPVFRLSPAATRSKGLCVSIDATAGRSSQSTRHALNTACARAAVRGYTFTPTLAPRNN